MVVHQIASNWRLAPLKPVDQALCAYAEKMTTTPQKIGDEDIASLRQHGLDDTAIHDAAQVISYFNYINRIADALDVEKEDFVRAWEQSPTKIVQNHRPGDG